MYTSLVYTRELGIIVLRFPWQQNYIKSDAQLRKTRKELQLINLNARAKYHMRAASEIEGCRVGGNPEVGQAFRADPECMGQ